MIIVLENQVDENITKDQFSELLSTLMKKYSMDMTLKAKNQQSSKDNDYDDISGFIFEFSDDENERFIIK